MTHSKQIQHWIAFAIALLGTLILVNVSAAENTTGDPWKMLILVYRNIDTDYTDIDGQAKHLTATMPLNDAENMVENFQILPHRNMVYDYSAHLGEMEAYVQYVDRALTDLEPIGNGYWPSPTTTAPELDQYAPPGKYDSVIVFWQASNPDTGQSIPVNGWGLGYWPYDYANNMTYATVFNISWVWSDTDPCRGEVFLHEWLHGLTDFYHWLGFPFPVDGVHGADEAGYTADQNGCWKDWYKDYMQGLVLEDGQYKALVPDTWHTGSVTTYDIQGWRAEYYNNETLSDLPVVVRDDAAIDFDWQLGSPHPLINPDHFSSRWTKDFDFAGGRYQFNITRNDGLRIFIDDSLVFNEWKKGSATRVSDIDVSPGMHKVTVEQYEIKGPAGAVVNWALLPEDQDMETYISPSGKATLGGIAAKPADILRYVKSTNTWTMVYRGSAHNTTKNITAVHIMDDGSLLLVFSANQVIPGLGTATPYDVVKFTPDDPAHYPLQEGTFSWFFNGKQYGLSAASEKIDALDVVGDRLLLSTTGTATVTLPGGATLKPAKEDVFAFDMATGQWESALVIDGSTIPALARNNIRGVWDDPASDDYYVIVSGAFKLGNVKGSARNIVRLTPNGGSYTPSFVDWLAPGVKPPTNLDGLDMVK